jgi:hypothetical protein
VTKSRSTCFFLVSADDRDKVVFKLPYDILWMDIGYWILDIGYSIPTAPLKMNNFFWGWIKDLRCFSSLEKTSSFLFLNEKSYYIFF